ncbi:MAG TPA: hypothetical protein VFM45_13120 [Anaeromyxobacteraceae bacterium]|nr:hypothetical protein [Anaeromyxobacteraceae bacterium]
MKRTIRLMTWLAVAAAAPAAYAGSGDAAKADKETSEKQMVLPTRADEDAGGGRGELPGQQIDRHARADAATADQRAKEVETIKQYNERKFLEEVWTRP